MHIDLTQDEQHVPIGCLSCNTPLPNDINEESEPEFVTCTSCGAVNNLKEAVKATEEAVVESVKNQIEDQLKDIFKNFK